MKRVPLAILISGRGSNMETLLEAADRSGYPAEPVLVLSNKADAAGLETARKRGIRAVAVPHRDYASREAHDRAVHAELVRAKADFIALAGYMRVLSPWFVREWEGRMVNIHPSLLPKYKGLRTHERALEAGDSHAGCSVHWVSEGVDDGAVIARSRVPVEPGDTAETLAARVLEAEHKLYPDALRAALAEFLSEDRAAGRLGSEA